MMLAPGAYLIMTGTCHMYSAVKIPLENKKSKNKLGEIFQDRSLKGHPEYSGGIDAEGSASCKQY